MVEDFEGKLEAQVSVLFYPNPLHCVVQCQRVRLYPGKLDYKSVLVKGMERIVDETARGFPARLYAHGAEPGYDARFCIFQVERRDEQVRVFRKPFLGRQPCLR